MIPISKSGHGNSLLYSSFIQGLQARCRGTSTGSYFGEDSPNNKNYQLEKSFNSSVINTITDPPVVTLSTVKIFDFDEPPHLHSAPKRYAEAEEEPFCAFLRCAPLYSSSSPPIFKSNDEDDEDCFMAEPDVCNTSNISITEEPSFCSLLMMRGESSDLDHQFKDNEPSYMFEIKRGDPGGNSTTISLCNFSDSVKDSSEIVFLSPQSKASQRLPPEIEISAENTTSSISHRFYSFGSSSPKSIKISSSDDINLFQSPSGCHSRSIDSCE